MLTNSQGKNRVPKSRGQMVWDVFRPLLMILLFTGLGFAVLLIVGLLFPEYSSRAWTWILYFFGCVVIFFTLLRKHKRGVPPGGPGKGPEPSAHESPESHYGRKLEELRKQIRHRKQSRDKRAAEGED